MPFPWGDNYEIAKIHWQNLKKKGSSGSILIYLCTKRYWVNGIQVFASKDNAVLEKEVIVFFSVSSSYLPLCFLIVNVSQVSDMAHESLRDMSSCPTCNFCLFWHWHVIFHTWVFQNEIMFRVHFFLSWYMYDVDLWAY